MNSRIYNTIRPALLVLPIIILILMPQCRSANTDKVIADFKTVLGKMKNYDYGQSHEWLEDFQNVMMEVYNHQQIYPEIEALMLDALKDDISFAAKQMICSYLGPIASGKAVPVLKDMLVDEQLSAIALAALQPIPDHKVDQALMEALPITGSMTRAGIINVIALRKVTEGTGIIAELISDPDPVVCRSAVDALGKIGTPEAVESLKKAFEGPDSTMKWPIANAWLLCADNMKLTDPDNALSIYMEIYDSNPPYSTLYAALRGIIACDQGKGESLVQNILTTRDPEWQTLVIPLVRNLKPGTDLSTYLDALPYLGEYQQMQLFTALADRKELAVKEIVKEAVNHSNPDIKLAALRALLNIAGATDIEFLAGIAAKTRGRERDMARECLEMLKGDDVNAVIIDGLQNADPKIRVEFIRSVGERNLKSGVEPVLKTLHDQDRRVRLEAYKVLGKLAGPEHLKDILYTSLEAGSSAERNEAERTITLISQKIVDEDKRIDDILNILPEVKDDQSLVMLIQAMGDIGCKKALPVIREYLGSEKTVIHIASIKALSVWPDSAPLEDLRKVLESSEDIKAHSLAMNGYIRLIQIDNAMSEEEKSEAFKHAMELAKNIDEKRVVVSGLSSVRTKSAFQMAVGLLENPELRPEAEAAISSIAGSLGRIDPDYTRKELNRIIEATDNPEFKARLQEILKWMD